MDLHTTQAQRENLAVRLIIQWRTVLRLKDRWESEDSPVAMSKKKVGRGQEKKGQIISVAQVQGHPNKTIPFDL